MGENNGEIGVQTGVLVSEEARETLQKRRKEENDNHYETLIWMK